jgi:phosphate transport system permease protein
MTKKMKVTYKSFAEFSKTDKANKNLRKRYRKEKSFKVIGFVAIFISISFLSLLIVNIASKAGGAFFNTEVSLNINLEEGLFKKGVEEANYRRLFNASLKENYAKRLENRRERNKVVQFFTKNASSQIKNYVINNPDSIGQRVDIWVGVSSKIDQYYKGNSESISGYYLDFIEENFPENKIKTSFSLNYFNSGDSTNPEMAGIGVALIGTLLTVMIFLLVSFPLAVLLALYLEEFAKKNKFADFIEININNLAAIPSIIFGLLGLSVFINMFGAPRSSALVGGFTLSLMVLPTIVIATRNSIKAIPQNIKDAALALGASEVQVAIHHTLPLAFPGILTGTILAVARAIGETAPLLMIGMVAFIVDIPGGFSDPTTVLPVQIYLWSNNPEVGFVEKTAATIMILLGFLVIFNSGAIYLRNKFSKRW